ncbi:hypothetical protein, conserved in T. vivax, partial [Trypanosoma vivax Y486]
MAFRFSLALLAAILLNDAVLGDDSTSSGALAGADGKRNAPSRGGDAGCKSEARGHNGDKLVVLNSAPTTPSETVRKSASVVKRMSDQSSLSSRNEVGNNHVGVGNELPDHPATSHEAQARAGDKHGMKLPHARRPATSRHSEGGLTSNNPKKSAEVVDHKKEFENVVNGIIAEEAENFNAESYPPGYPVGTPYGEPYNTNQNDYGSYGGSGEPSTNVVPGDSSSVQSNNSTSVSAPSSTTSPVSSSENSRNSAAGSENKTKTDDDNAPKDEGKEKKDVNEKEEKQLEQRSNENSDGQETNNSSEETENKKAPSWGNSAFLCGSCS